MSAAFSFAGTDPASFGTNESVALVIDRLDTPILPTLGFRLAF